MALPWPAAKHGRDGRRLPATYANFLVINGAVLDEAKAENLHAFVDTTKAYKL